MNRLYVGSLLCLLLSLAGLNAADGAGTRGIVDTLGTVADVAKVVGPPVVSGAKAVGGAVIGHRNKTKRIESLEASSEVHAKDLAELKNIVETGAAHQEEFIKKQIKTVSDKMPTAKHPKGFVIADPKDPVVRQGQLGDYVTQADLQKATAPFVRYNPENPLLLRNEAKAYVDEQLVDVVKEQPGNSVVRQDQIVGVVRQDQIVGVVRQGQIEGMITIQHVKAALEYFAKQSALGGAAYCSSPVIESLLRSAGMENEYIELKTISVPATTFLISLSARWATKIYEDKGVDLQEVAKESAYDAGTSAAVMGLKSFFCDDQMCKEIDEKMSEKNRTAAYAFSYGVLRSILALFV